MELNEDFINALFKHPQFKENLLLWASENQFTNTDTLDAVDVEEICKDLLEGCRFTADVEVQVPR